MSYAEIIHDLQALRVYFMEASGAVPVCLDEAIGIITALMMKEGGVEDA